jgi:hypothetical protein
MAIAARVMVRPVRSRPESSRRSGGALEPVLAAADLAGALGIGLARPRWGDAHSRRGRVDQCRDRAVAQATCPDKPGRRFAVASAGIAVGRRRRPVFFSCLLMDGAEGVGTSCVLQALVPGGRVVDLACVPPEERPAET